MCHLAIFRFIINIVQDLTISAFHIENARKCKVLFSYKPANRDELELNIDDVIEVLGEVEEGWWKGELRNEVSTDCTLTKYSLNSQSICFYLLYNNFCPKYLRVIYSAYHFL